MQERTIGKGLIALPSQVATTLVSKGKKEDLLTDDLFFTYFNKAEAWGEKNALNTVKTGFNGRGHA